MVPTPSTPGTLGVNHSEGFPLRAASMPAAGVPSSLPGRIGRFGKIAAVDALGRPQSAGDRHDHLQAAVSWLTRAHDRGGGGVSYGYGLLGGWRPPYPEVSGYISSTFFDLAARSGETRYRTRAIAVCEWLCGIQNADGSIANPEYGEDGIVFDTGQVVEGYVRAYRETGEPKFLDAANRAAAWLVAVADCDGRWTRQTFLDLPHVYDARTAWRLLELNDLSPHDAYLRVARANLEWALEQQNDTGWFDHCAFRRGAAPFTHTIAYAIEGLLGAGILLHDDRYVDAARRSAEAALRHLRQDGFIPGQIGIDDECHSSYSCLTGNCQFGLVWCRLFERSGDERFRAAARLALQFVMGCQATATGDLDVRGAIKGSQPVWGRYAAFVFPSWAAKFFIDAMLSAWTWPQWHESGS